MAYVAQESALLLYATLEYLSLVIAPVGILKNCAMKRDCPVNFRINTESSDYTGCDTRLTALQVQDLAINI